MTGQFTFRNYFDHLRYDKIIQKVAKYRRFTFYTYYRPLLKNVLHGQLRGIDNSNFLIDSEQLEFFQQQMMLGIRNKLQRAGAWKGAVWSWGYLKSNPFMIFELRSYPPGFFTS